MHDGAAARALTTDTMMESSERSPRAVARMDGELSEDFSLRSLSQYYHVLSFHLHPSEKKIRTLLKTRDKHTAPSASGPIRGIRSLRSSRRDRSRRRREDLSVRRPSSCISLCTHRHGRMQKAPSEQWNLEPIFQVNTSQNKYSLDSEGYILPRLQVEPNLVSWPK